MPRLPARFAALVRAFAPVFLQQRTWRHAELLRLADEAAARARGELADVRRFVRQELDAGSGLRDPVALAQVDALLGVLEGQDEGGEAGWQAWHGGVSRRGWASLTVPPAAPPSSPRRPLSRPPNPPPNGQSRT